MTRFHLHLVSDSTGETVHSVARACLVQFDDAHAVEHVWSMVRTRSQVDRVIAGVEANPGVVLFTLVSETLRQLLQEGCRRLQIPAIPGRLVLTSTAKAEACRVSSTCSTANISRGSMR
jgi:[pyruvate, water dikinase]-phosphate phosphotransferase / [pyruvate, water dikinase] kinase